MEHGTQIVEDEGYLPMAYAGWEWTQNSSSLVSDLFNAENISKLSKQITEALKGVDSEGRDIVVPNDTITGLLSTFVRDGKRTGVGDMYTTDIMTLEIPRNDYQNIMEQTINVIVNQIRTEYETIECNRKLNRWDATVLGDFNALGLRRHAPIKLRNKHPGHMQFNMNY